MQKAIARPADERVNFATSIPMIACHFVPLLAIFTGVTTKAVILCVALYFGRMFFITAGYHRYFAHRSYKTNRVFQFILAAGGATAAQKGPLWWAGHHRDHHRFSDTERDIHSPQKGFWWSHMGWILCDKYNTVDYEAKIKDFHQYPEIRWVEKHNGWFPIGLAVLCTLIAGWSGLLIGFFLSTVLLWHGTFTVNSLNHVFGRRRYATTDTSRNSAILALWTMGEGWHNNHHYYAASARQGFFWWEYDISYYVLKALSLVGVVSDLKTPPRWARDAARVRDGQLDIGMFRAHWQRATAAFSAATSHASDKLSSAKAALADRLGGESPAASPATATEATPLEGVAGVSLATEALSADTPAEQDARSRREQMEEVVRAHRAALEESIETTLRHAEALSRATKLHQRELRLAAAES
ncbi:MAG TPA: acyl-CoA desaturase [Acidimicrobiales bacterium]|nr:acyl-CoA desaturase [Acidimicrobiales bacterium]